MADFIDEATSNEMADRFARRIADARTVYLLRCAEGYAKSESNTRADENDEPLPVILFFSDTAYARAVQKACYPDYDVATLSLADFLERWLPGMEERGTLAGVNWRADLCGPEREARDLRIAIEALLSH